MSKSTRGDIVNKSVTELPGPGAYSRTNEFGKDAKSVSISYFFLMPSVYYERETRG